jgi:hypothetical protein
MPDSAEESRRRLLELPPRRHVIFPHIDVVPATETMDRRIVELVVDNGSAIVLDRILDSGDCYDEYQRHRVQSWVHTAEDREYLED